MERHVPTESHLLWGGAVEVHAFGTPHNWSLAGETPDDADRRNPGIIDRMRALAHEYNCQILAPSPKDFNGQVVLPRDLRQEWIHGLLRRGASADGVILTSPCTAFAVSSGDCPTVIMRNISTGAVIAAHAGRDSLIKEDGGLIRQMTMGLLGASGKPQDLRAFIACGIDYRHFTHPLADPKDGERNRRLHAFACRYDGAADYDEPEGRIHLPNLIAGQMIERGLQDSRIGFDGSDTYADADPYGNLHWHSHRRGDKTRNLVLVIRRR